MKHSVLLRLEEDQYQKVRAAASHFGESLQGFMMNALLLRMQTGSSPVKLDPFEEALLQLQKNGPKAKLSKSAEAAVVADRIAIRNGTGRSIDAAQGLADLEERIAKRRAKAAK